jgi:hypothetical protein
MKAKVLLPLIAATLFSLSAHAHDCSGGPDGGIDATGNQCNDTVAVGTIASSNSTSVAPDRWQKVDTKSAPCDKCAAKRTTSTRHATGRQRNKHG